MNKKFKLFPIALVSMFAVSLIPSAINAAKAEAKTYYVDFFNNYKREEFTLSSGFKGKGNNLLFTTVQVSEGSLVSKPENPTRKNYAFQGWYKEEKCQNEWDFASMTVNENTRLFAKWVVSDAGDIVEPTYTPPSTLLEESNPNDYVIDSIMYFSLLGDSVKLPTAAISRLEANKDNVLPLIEYRVKASKTLTATYNEMVITLTCGDNVRNITVQDNKAAYVVGNETYETKAAKYEAKYESENENYHVMLAGSSSIEFWETSKQDLAPIVSYNHGIGGTTIEQWDTKLNQRLVFPYKPKMVVYYVGINNVINSGESASKISTRLTDFFDHTHAALPNTQIQYIMMNLIPGYPGKFNVINTVNANVVSYQASHPWLTLINPGEALLKENGEPSAAYFRTDGLHLSYYGYVIWGGIIKESILEGLENM